MANQMSVERLKMKNFHNDPEAFAVKMNLLPDKKEKYQCIKCIKNLKNRRSNNSIFVCTKCYFSISYLKGTIFEKSKMSVKTVLYLALQWSKDESYENVQDHPETLNISRDAINQWFHKFRQIVETELDRIHGQETIEGNEAQEQFEGPKIKKINLITGNKSDIRRILSNNSDASCVQHYFKKRKLTAPHNYYHLKDCQWKRMIKSQNKHVFIEFLKLCAREFPPKLNDFMAKNIPIDLPE